MTTKPMHAPAPPLAPRRPWADKLAALPGLGTLLRHRASSETSQPEPEVLFFGRSGWVPNNPHLPVVIFRQALQLAAKSPATAIEQLFRKNGWKPGSRNGIFDFHHFHSTTHETLGFISGQARLMLGGEDGTEVTLKAGDVVVLPVGTGHRRLEASRDLVVIGAYPQHRDWDICKSAPDSAAQQRMLELPLPSTDPLTGPEGTLLRLWSNA